MNEPGTGPIPTPVMAATLSGALLAPTHMAAPAGQQHEAPWAKEECDEEGLHKP